MLCFYFDMKHFGGGSLILGIKITRTENKRYSSMVTRPNKKRSITHIDHTQIKRFSLNYSITFLIIFHLIIKNIFLYVCVTKHFSFGPVTILEFLLKINLWTCKRACAYIVLVSKSILGGLYWIMILRDFKILFYHEKVLWYLIKTFSNLKKKSCSIQLRLFVI